MNGGSDWVVNRCVLDGPHPLQYFGFLSSSVEFCESARSNFGSLALSKFVAFWYRGGEGKHFASKLLKSCPCCEV